MGTENRFRMYYELLRENAGFNGKQAELNAEIIELLELDGINIEVQNNSLTITLSPALVKRLKQKKNSATNVGRKKFVAFTKHKQEYRYSDIVYLSQIYKNADVCKKTGIKLATFYRHKRDMVESDYYKSLDLNRLRDLEYLRSVKGDEIF